MISLRSLVLRAERRPVLAGFMGLAREFGVPLLLHVEFETVPFPQADGPFVAGHHQVVLHGQVSHLPSQDLGVFAHAAIHLPQLLISLNGEPKAEVFALARKGSIMNTEMPYAAPL